MTTSTTQSDTEKWTNPLRNPRDMRLPRIAGPCSLVIFGVTGDLSKKKLIPAVYDLANRGLLPAGFGLVGLVAANGVTRISRTLLSKTLLTMLVLSLMNPRGNISRAAFASFRVLLAMQTPSSAYPTRFPSWTMCAEPKEIMRSTCLFLLATSQPFRVSLLILV